MNRQFALPISFAVALHAALLFGFSKPPRVNRAPEEKPTREFVMLEPAPEEDPLPDIACGGEPHEIKAAIDAPVPISPEPTPVDPGNVITVPMPPFRPYVEVDTRILPTTFVTGSTGDNERWKNVVPTTLLDKSPATRFQPAPTYPFEAKSAGLHGEVVVEFVVDERGRVQSPRVVSSTHRVFEEATLRAVSRWVFEPGRREGRVVRFRMSVPVMFNLNE